MIKLNHHFHPQEKKIINRLARIEGHTKAIKRMAEEGKECSEILIQIAAVRSALNNVGKLILQDHINHCIIHAIENDDREVLDSLNDAINKFVK
ncbi:metal-sensing transcriptional repressor [Wukongibacter baidiensis]|uniref:metal-sensing transcriptional repressor n=1 Tax=Wukongibacter baidiensis TaxID=1723361 RepID=UPI003D7FEF47